MASSEIVEPSISIRTPVSTGQHVVAAGGGDRLGDGVGEPSLCTVPVAAGMSGRVG